MKRYIDLEDMVNVNCSNVLDIIQKSKEISRKEITRLSGLSWGGMTKIVNRLLENEYIIEKKNATKNDSGKHGGGRIPTVLAVNSEKNFVIGIDINKTGLNAMVMNLAGEALRGFSAPVKATNADDFLLEIIAFIKSIFACFKEKSIISAGIAMQGSVDIQNGVSLRFPGIDQWHSVKIKEILQQELGIHFYLEHDPDCLLYPHIHNGKKENTLLLRIDKSVGMAAAINGKIIKGTGIFEIAHTIAIAGGKKCECGLCGCLEAYVKACTSDAQALKELVLPLAITLKNLTDIFRADRVILTGSLMEDNDDFAMRLKSELSLLQCDLTPEFHPTGDFAMRGAALIAIAKSIDSLMI